MQRVAFNAADDLGALTALRLRYLANGYKPVPVTGPQMRTKCAGKRPIMSRWQQVCAAADEGEVRQWTSTQRDCINTGLLCGELIGLDIDVPVPELAKQVEALARVMLPPTPLRRTGQAPKSLLCFRAQVLFRKIETP